MTATQIATFWNYFAIISTTLAIATIVWTLWANRNKRRRQGDK